MFGQSTIHCSCFCQDLQLEVNLCFNTIIILAFVELSHMYGQQLAACFRPTSQLKWIAALIPYKPQI